jgi:two-component system, cell cycle response regulator DivK
MSTTTTSSAPAKNPHTILIVEDHPLVAKFYRMALERAGGFTCLVTEDVPEMIGAVESGRADLAILDISLRGSEWQGRPIDGLELARILKQRAPRPFPIVLATAHAMRGDRERLLEASGADAYLEKPIYDAEQLVGVVRRLLTPSEHPDNIKSPSSPPQEPK